LFLFLVDGYFFGVLLDEGIFLLSLVFEELELFGGSE
jgi:hypothetical protein